MKQQFSGDEQALIVRVLIADDSDIVLCALSTALKSLSEIEVVGLARDGLQALESAQKTTP